MQVRLQAGGWILTLTMINVRHEPRTCELQQCRAARRLVLLEIA